MMNKTDLEKPENSGHPAAKAAGPRRNPGPNYRKITGGMIGILSITGAVLLALWVWNIYERNPRTDDATARANVVGITPRVAGQIVKIHVHDNQWVNEGEPLFDIDAEDYHWALEKAKSQLESLDRQIEVARGQDASLKYAVKAGEAAVERAKAQLKQTTDTLRRLQPLLPKGFATAEQVEQAQTAESVATSALAAEEEHLNQAKAALSTLETLNAQRPGAVAAVRTAEIALARCRVVAPFNGRVISLNISEGAYANVGIPVFAFLDARKWYVMANFREGETKHIEPGMKVKLYLSSAPRKQFQGIVQGIGWAVEPDDEIVIQGKVPAIKRELNWVHIAQRFPVRIEVTAPDQNLFRMGASAVVIVKTGGGK